jgi:acyl-CoA synthetase (AMP-forming)/AMP-acid ligase II
MMLGLQMDMPLTITAIIEHAARYHGATEVAARTIEGDVFRYTYAEAHVRMKRLAQALLALGIDAGERVGSLAWNTHRHFELFYGVSGTGAVLHTVNPRLTEDQIVYIINHAEDAVLCVDAATLPLYRSIAARLTTIRNVIVLADANTMPAFETGQPLLCYEDLLAAQTGEYTWPLLDERTASSICYTSGTTGNPKGVVYSHRSAVLMAMQFSSFIGMRNGVPACLMPLAPMFHGNAWQFPYLAPMIGARLVLPGRDYQPARLHELIEGERVTVACGVPTMWIALCDWLKQTGAQVPNLHLALSSGSALPRTVSNQMGALGVECGQVWGMTEVICGSLASMTPPESSQASPMLEAERPMAAGCASFGVAYRLVDDDGHELPQDGSAIGHLRVKAPWAASAYFKGEGSAVDNEGWLVTGDIVSIDSNGRIQMRDRAKDIIKSGGEWISSCEIEAAAAGHPEIAQAAAIAMAHPKWQERPHLIVQRRAGTLLDDAAVRSYLESRLPKWWMPDAITFVAEIPLTPAGKIDKRAVRAMSQASEPGIKDVRRLGA